MPSDFHRLFYTRPKYSKPVYRSLMTTLSSVLGFDTSDKAKFRFHVLRVFYEGGVKAVKLSFPELKRSTLYRWKKDYERSGKMLNSLVPKSTRPLRFRQSQIPLPIISLVRTLRQKYPRMGKAKIKRFVWEFCLANNISTVSEASIGRIIKRFNMFYAGKNKGKRTRDCGQKQRIKLCPKASDTKPGYIQLDGLKFYYLGRYYYFLTAVDIVSKQAWVRLVPSLSSKHASLFLKEIINTSWYSIHVVQTDNGSEFELFFEQAVQEAGFIHLWNYPKHPKTTGFVERLNWTVQDEFLFSYEDFLLYPEDFNTKLVEWITWYNEGRPHQSLNYLSPYENFQKGGLSQKY